MASTKAILPELDLLRIRRYCATRVPARVSDEVRIEVEVSGRTVTILECRPPWNPDFGTDWTRFPIARLRHFAAQNVWVLYWRDRNLHWHIYDRLDPSPHVEVLLAEIDSDPACFFWG